MIWLSEALNDQQSRLHGTSLSSYLSETPLALCFFIDSTLLCHPSQLNIKILCICLLLGFSDRISSGNLGWPRTWNPWTLSPERWDYRFEPPHMALGYFLHHHLPQKKGRVGEIRKRNTPSDKTETGCRGATRLLLSGQTLLCYILKLGPLSSQKADFPRWSDSWNHQECVFVLASYNCGGKRGPLGGSQKAMPELLTG